MAVGAFREIERAYFDFRWHLDPVAATPAGGETHRRPPRGLHPPPPPPPPPPPQAPAAPPGGGGAALADLPPPEAARLAAAADGAAAALEAFARDLERWRETASEQFALGDDDFNFHLHYEHALRDTAPELWRYGLHLKEELEADLARRAARLDHAKRWPDVADRLRADHPPATGLVKAYATEMARARDSPAPRA